MNPRNRNPTSCSHADSAAVAGSCIGSIARDVMATAQSGIVAKSVRVRNAVAMATREGAWSAMEMNDE